MACAETFGGMDAGNSAQELQLEPWRRPKQSSLNITYLSTKLDQKLEYSMKLGLEVLGLIDPLWTPTGLNMEDSCYMILFVLYIFSL